MSGQGQVQQADSGFSLVEIVVALGLAMTVFVAVLPQLIVGIKAAALATELTVTKGVIQGHLEKMRSLPYHVAPSAERRIDVLDTYYPNLTPPTASTFDCQVDGGGDYASWSGHVSAGAGCPFEPQVGAFYRKVEPVTSVSGDEYVLITNTQFLTSATTAAQTGSYAPTVAALPDSGYNSQNTTGLDVPVSSQIAVTVTAFSLDRGLDPVTVYTQISEQKGTPVRAQGKVSAVAFNVGSTSPLGNSLTLAAGGVDIAGMLSRASSVTATVAATSARRAVGAPVGSIIGPEVAPFVLTPTLVDSDGGTLLETCVFACWDATAVDAFTISAAGGLPNAGLSSAGVLTPLEGRVTDLSTHSGVRFSNTRPEDRAATDIGALRLDPNQPLVQLTSGSDVTTAICGTSRGGKIAGRGFLRTTADQLETCAEAATSTVSMFPTAFAPAGVVRMTLSYAAAQCRVNPRAATRVATYRYSALVEYKDPAGGYKSVTVSGTSTTLPGTGPLAALLDETVHSDDEGTLKLGDYIDTWSSPNISSVAVPTTTATSAEATLPGVIRILSKPVRQSIPSVTPDPGDLSSVISLTLGAVGCYAEDAR